MYTLHTSTRTKMSAIKAKPVEGCRENIMLIKDIDSACDCGEIGPVGTDRESSVRQGPSLSWAGTRYLGPAVVVGDWSCKSKGVVPLVHPAQTSRVILIVYI